MSKSREQLKTMIQEEGDWKEDEYKGIKYEIKRHPILMHLCGYVFIENLTDEQYEILDSNFHCGVTFKEEGKYGFDCAHAFDLVPAQYFMFKHDTKLQYRTMSYVEENLKYTIDQLEGE